MLTILILKLNWIILLSGGNIHFTTVSTYSWPVPIQTEKCLGFAPLFYGNNYPRGD